MMDNCRRCGKTGEIRDLLCYTCAHEVKSVQTGTTATITDIPAQTGVNHYYPTNLTTPPEVGEEAICGHILTSVAVACNVMELQTYCKTCVELVRSSRNATLFAEVG